MANNSVFSHVTHKMEQKGSKCFSNKVATYSDELSLEMIDFCIKKNGTNHHTSDYELMKRSSDPSLVLRRGEVVEMQLNFNRNFDHKIDEVKFHLTDIDAQRYEAKIQKIKLLHKYYYNGKEWTCYVNENKNGVVKVWLNTPVNSALYRLSLTIEIRTKNNQPEYYKVPMKMYIICNPWNPKDQVYLDDYSKIQEYVMEDHGCLLLSNYSDSFNSLKWEFGQFEIDILDCCFYLLKTVRGVKSSSKNNMVKIVRELSAAVNSNDDNGVIVGNWNTVIADNVAPSEWSSSVKILQQYYGNKKPVKYGQCWVYSGVLTTVCRAFGIPTRNITNLASGHDSDGSLTIDKFLDENGNDMNISVSDYIWNYHVWNEVWMKRPDLDQMYNGWQAIDATPQERSNRVFRCGPAPVLAIKHADFQVDFDTRQYYAEVNADEVTWKYSKSNRDVQLYKVNESIVGSRIGTKAVGKWELEDVTYNYKYPEGSKEERATMKKALSLTNSAMTRLYLSEFAEAENTIW